MPDQKDKHIGKLVIRFSTASTSETLFGIVARRNKYTQSQLLPKFYNIAWFNLDGTTEYQQYRESDLRYFYNLVTKKLNEKGNEKIEL